MKIISLIFMPLAAFVGLFLVPFIFSTLPKEYYLIIITLNKIQYFIYRRFHTIVTFKFMRSGCLSLGKQNYKVDINKKIGKESTTCAD